MAKSIPDPQREEITYESLFVLRNGLVNMRVSMKTNRKFQKSRFVLSVKIVASGLNHI